MLDVFFYEAFEEEEQAIKHYLPPHIKAGFTWKTIQEEEHHKSLATIVSIRTQSIIPISYATKIKGLLTRSTGYDHIWKYLQKCRKDLPCGYLPKYCSRAVAEQTMLLWMSLLRKLPQQVQQFTNFNRDGLTGQECQHKTLLIVGVGHIGYEVVQIGKCLGMEVMGVDIDEKHPDVSYVSIDKGLSQADIVICAMNLTADNIGYFNYQVLKQGKPGMIFINISRGELSSTVDLLHLMDEKFLGGIALDVYDKESQLAILLRRGNTHNNKDMETRVMLELAKRSNVILTPHNAFNTQEAVAKKSAHSVQQITYFLENGKFLWPVP
ncbi:NAD(P)-dependent oxidoreductase [Candidatus Parabeggiatoa sp. HSG14]|uniref:NAD(P)-dependent oxidoreductase n=1 Tax=Candidatus Parabeggiatoa sp. HSG14 TaxID=3055593 RepID=UPI0025A69A0F|nr:NAD(P)-dependent oxidoreductase [Thiotrichales bacterium HSG14]